MSSMAGTHHQDDAPAEADPAVAGRPSPPGSRSPWTRANLVLGGALVAGAAGYLTVVDPNTSAAYPPCPLRALTGIDCAGCGGLRCTHALLTGDVQGALDHNVLLVAAVPVLAYLAVRWLAARAGRQLPAPRWTPAMSWIALVVLIVFSVVRNVPWGPLAYLHSDLS